MDIIVYSDSVSWIHRLDPRVRILAATLITVVLSQASQPLSLCGGLGLGWLALMVARVPLAAILQRLVPLNAVILLLVGALLFLTPGEAIFRIGSIHATWEGAAAGAIILFKANAIVSLIAALVGSIELVALGQALSQLHVPAKLVNILFFTVRYINLMLAEYERLTQAAMLRGFRPGANRHTLRTTGYLIGMILVGSYARGARVLDAMKLRGYEGHFAWVKRRTLRATDKGFLVASVIVALLVAGIELQ